MLLIFNYSQIFFRQANERREVAEKRSTSARNDYLLYISAMNAHQTKYYALDLPDLIAVSVFFFKYIQFYLKKYYNKLFLCYCEFQEWIQSFVSKLLWVSRMDLFCTKKIFYKHNKCFYSIVMLLMLSVHFILLSWDDFC